MFMFWGKRTSYTKRLLKAQVRGEHETEREAQEKNNLHLHTIVGNRNSPESSSSSSSRSNYNYNYNNKKEEKQYNNGCCSYAASVLINGNNSSTAQEVNNKSNDIINNRTARCKEFLKTLKENQLEMLLAAVESYGANLGPCVMVKRRRRGSDADADADLDIDLDPNPDLPQTSDLVDSPPDCCRVREDGLKGMRDVADGGTESFKMTTTTSNTSTKKQIQDRNSPDHSPNRSHHHYHHHHHHRHNHQHHYNNHNRVQRQQRQFINVNVNVNQNEDNNSTVNNHAGAADDKLLFLKDRQRDYEENILLGERIATTTTSSSSSTRRSRNSGNSDTELPVDPHLLCCQIWRWPDLTNSSELKRLPVCHSAKDPVDICCNPYHWSRLCKPESPPPPYCLIADRLRPEDRAPSEGGGGDGPIGRYRNTNSPPLPGSLTTNGEDLSGQREWCTLAYWELGGRVGRLYPVEPSTVNVFDSLLDGDGLCLATLAENHPTPPAIQRTRSKIGLGLMLSQESDGVWAYNRSENPIFVNSPTLDDPESRTLLVYRVPPGFCLNIFDRVQKLQKSYNIKTPESGEAGCEEKGFCCGADYCDNNCCPTCTVASPIAPLSTPASAGNFPSGPVDVNSVRISFAKGWGPKYSRQEVTSCPCWLEVLLAPCR